MLCWITILGGVLIMMGQHSRSEASFMFILFAVGQSDPFSRPSATDWSHHHLLFSQPATAEQLKRVQQNPRYWQQLLRRSQATPPEAELDVAPTRSSTSASL